MALEAEEDLDEEATLDEALDEEAVLDEEAAVFSSSRAETPVCRGAESARTRDDI